MPHLLPPARLFVPAKGKSGVEDIVAVNPYRSAAKFRDNTMRFADIFGLYSRRQAVNAIIRRRDDFFDILKRHGADYWAEDLFLNDFPVGLRIDQHGWFQKISLV